MWYNAPEMTPTGKIELAQLLPKESDELERVNSAPLTNLERAWQQSFNFQPSAEPLD